MIINIDAELSNYCCDLCCEHKERLLYIKKGVLTNYGFRVVQCKNCGLIYLNPRLNDDAVIKLYDERYYSGEGFDPYVNYSKDIAHNDDINKIFWTDQRVKIINELVSPPAKLLDFGCGLGDLLQKLQKCGYQAEGYEVSKYSIDYNKANGFIIYNNIDQIPQNKYDIIIAIEVLEHCSSPLKMLTAIYRSLKPGGIFYYTTENFSNFYIKMLLGMKRSLDGYVVPEGHIHFYSTKTMEAYFHKIGFREVFSFEPKTYLKNGRLFKYLSMFGFVDLSDRPTGILNKGIYYGLRKLFTVLGVRRKPLPLARK
jgi:2-polyprenyl-3-methyl-5-hydroxy-6-metoxy-1,4-benzoquinol methylase